MGVYLVLDLHVCCGFDKAFKTSYIILDRYVIKDANLLQSAFILESKFNRLFICYKLVGVSNKNTLFYMEVAVFMSKRVSQTVSTTPLRQWGFQKCLPFSWTTLKGKHCRHPVAIMGVVDTF